MCSGESLRKGESPRWDRVAYPDLGPSPHLWASQMWEGSTAQELRLEYEGHSDLLDTGRASTARTDPKRLRDQETP